MVSSRVTVELKALIEDLRKNKLYTYFTYPLFIVYVGFPLWKRLKSKRKGLVDRKEAIEQKLRTFIEKTRLKIKKTLHDIEKNDTYIIFTDKTRLLEEIQPIYKDLQFLYLHSELFPKDFNEEVVFTANELVNEKKIIEEFNREFVARRKKEYSALWKRSSVNLDDDQLTAIVTDEKYNLVVAGAGSGKTEVLIIRIAYLIKRKQNGIRPNRILALAFQNKAKDEIAQRLKLRFGLDVKIKTFHSRL